MNVKVSNEIVKTKVQVMNPRMFSNAADSFAAAEDLTSRHFPTLNLADEHALEPIMGCFANHGNDIRT